MNNLKWFLLCLVVLWFSVPVLAQKKFSTCREIDAAEFNAFIQQNRLTVVIDIRDKKAFRKGRIPGAIWAPTDKVLRTIVDTLDVDRPVLVYDAYGESSVDGCLIVSSRGILQACHLRGGLANWLRQGLPLERGKSI
ncbi:MAG: rhodanese-like domain-containing protein [Bacteroidota bacterium]|nr:rhodanese-like domain-containing protein [Bacteroidota bacterium]